VVAPLLVLVLFVTDEEDVTTFSTTVLLVTTFLLLLLLVLPPPLIVCDTADDPLVGAVLANRAAEGDSLPEAVAEVEEVRDAIVNEADDGDGAGDTASLRLLSRALRLAGVPKLAFAPEDDE
jgi:hypothetical protein